MSHPIGDQQRVFLAYRALFGGQNALIRKRKKIRQLVQSHRQSTQSLIQDLGDVKTVSILQNLLERNIFSSEIKAKLAFPSLFQVSAVQEAQHTASEVGVAENEEKAIQQAQSLDIQDHHAETTDNNNNNEENHSPSGADLDADLDDGHVSAKEESPSNDALHPTVNGIQVPSLYPSYIPYRAQHLLLTKTQYLLEACCYEFTSKWTPDLLLKKKWDCPEAIELNKWARVMMKHIDKLSADALDDDYKADISNIFESVVKLRHSAVHRLSFSAKRLEDLINSAVSFVSVLRDPLRQSQMSELAVNLKRMLRSQELNKNFLETQLQEKLDDIQRQREELNKREKEAVATMVKEDEENKYLVGSLLEESIASILSKGKEGRTEADDEKPCESEHEAIDNPLLEAVDLPDCSNLSQPKAFADKLAESTRMRSTGFWRDFGQPNGTQFLHKNLPLEIVGPVKGRPETVRLVKMKAPKAEKPAEEPAEEPAPEEECPVEECPADAYPIEECPPEAYPMEECPPEVYPVEECPAEECPAEECPAEECPVEEYPVEEPEPEEARPDDRYLEELGICESASLQDTLAVLAKVTASVNIANLEGGPRESILRRLSGIQKTLHNLSDSLEEQVRKSGQLSSYC